jgi:hypothetical protein
MVPPHAILRNLLGQDFSGTCSAGQDRRVLSADRVPSIRQVLDHPPGGWRAARPSPCSPLPSRRLLLGLRLGSPDGHAWQAHSHCVWTLSAVWPRTTPVCVVPGCGLAMAVVRDRPQHDGLPLAWAFYRCGEAPRPARVPTHVWAVRHTGRP